MSNDITLILILHNRHDNLDRLIEYYSNYNFPIIIADSSAKKHVMKTMKYNWLHSYTPNLSFTQKIEVSLTKVNTPYVVMCADDDFIFPEALLQCVSFLKLNEHYSVAQGWAIRYYKDSIKTGRVRYGLLYDSYNDIEEDNPIERLKKMFLNYRSILYAVFKTEVLKLSFEGAGHVVKNLFLNEYITAFVPITLGKYKELPLLYQVREYAENSDDKTSANLDTIKDNPVYAKEFTSFRDFIVNKIASISNSDLNKTRQTIDRIIEMFSSELKANRSQKTSFKKNIGKLIIAIPFFGKKIINKSREKETAKQLDTVIKSHSEKQEIRKISGLLLKSQS